MILLAMALPRASIAERVDLVMTSNTGAIVIMEGAFTTLEPGIITSIAPARGGGGTVVSIFGKFLLKVP